ncbi:Integrase core domain [Popillia japonica]|uniref:Integrase core domain n=1 Tax=Popillia japonica TaxID=7064 RepID=A0AAW1HWJ2_POPJA
MKRFIKKYIDSCLKCLYCKQQGGKKPGYLHSIPKYARPQHAIRIDHLGLFIESENKNKYLLVVVDGFSKFVHLKAVSDTSAKPVIESLSEIFTVLGKPKRISSDAGAAFTSQNCKNFISDKNIRHFTIAVGLPRGNGQVERVNKTVLDALATRETLPEKWDTNLKSIQQGINSMNHRITQHAPAELLFAFKLRTDGDLDVSEEEEPLNVTKITKQASERLEQNRIKQDLVFNRKRKAPELFNVGDLVLTKITSLPAIGDSKKLVPKFRGPFNVVEVLPNDRYRVREDVHSSRSIRPYEAVIGVENLKHFKFPEYEGSIKKIKQIQAIVDNPNKENDSFCFFAYPETITAKYCTPEKIREALTKLSNPSLLESEDLTLIEPQRGYKKRLPLLKLK